jgi:hypothetical protein
MEGDTGGLIMMAEAGAEVEAGATESGASEPPQAELAAGQYEDETASQYGFLPYMATHSRGSVGSLLASSYAERINSAANLILTKGNTVLAEEEINMCTVLRMNRRFMEFMREYHPDAANQRFQMTVISEDFLVSSD